MAIHFYRALPSFAEFYRVSRTFFATACRVRGRVNVGKEFQCASLPRCKKKEPPTPTSSGVEDVLCWHSRFVFFSLQYRISRSIGLDWTLVTNFSRDRLEIALGSIFCSFSFHRVSLETTRSVFQSAPWYFTGFRGLLPSYKRNIKNKNGGYFSYVDSSIDFSIQPCVSGRGWTLFVLYWVSRTFTEFHGNKEPYLPWSLVSTFGFPFIVSGR